MKKLLSEDPSQLEQSALQEQDLPQVLPALDFGREAFTSDFLGAQGLRHIMGIATPMPDGAFYCFVDARPLMKRFGGDDTKLALHLLENGVAVVAASAFGGRDGFRISFAADETVLTEAMARIAAALKE